MLESYSRVRLMSDKLMSDKFRSQGAAVFEVGYVIKVYPNGDYEVEFFRH